MIHFFVLEKKENYWEQKLQNLPSNMTSLSFIFLQFDWLL